MTILTTDQMREIASTVHSKSAKIRALDRHGVTKSAIASFLGIKYQFVYNVLSRDAPKFETVAAAARIETSGDSSFVQLQLEEGGRVALPADYLEASGLRPGDAVICRRTADGLSIMTRAEALGHFGALLKQRMPDQADLIQLLLSENRTQSTNERET